MIDQYYNLDAILKLDLVDRIKNELKEKFRRKVYFESNGNCKVGKLVGLEKNYKLSEVYYIIDDEGKRLYVPTYKSLTLL